MARLSNVLLDHAGNVLQKEIAKFVDDNMKHPHGGMDAILLETAQWLQKEFQNKRNARAIIESVSEEDFSQQASLLRTFTQMWSIFQLAWRQSEGPDTEMSRAIAAGNKVARGLYEVSQTADLNLIILHQYLVVVPAGAEGYSVGFDSPTPYIISPYWGLSQVWTWLSYVHEIGHHVYHNVDGLEDELKVNVTLELWKQGKDRKYQLIWFHWLEEIFADLFGLMRIGEAFANTQQLMLPYLPQPVAWPNVNNRLLVADDMSHPMPYLRIFLSLSALKKLNKQVDNIESLQSSLNSPAGSEPPQEVYALVHGGSQALPLEEMKDMANSVLDAVLDTKLISLAKKSTPKVSRSLKEVFSDPESGKYEMFLADVYRKLKELPPGASNDDIEKLNERVINSIMEGKEAV